MDILLNTSLIKDLFFKENNNLIKEELSGWGLFPRKKVIKLAPRNINELKNAITSSSVIARGNGRSYGDSSINNLKTIDMRNFNRFLYFDASQGLLVSEAGVLLKEVIDIFLPKGWFPQVTPGTKFVTIGGMVAADIHGKNHLKDGSFGNHLHWIDIINNEGEIVRCSREENSDLFSWTLGGMGLTGIILRVAFFLRPVKTSWIKEKTFVARNVTQAFEIFEDNLNSTYSVAWIDCYSKGERLGRSLIKLGEHAEIEELSLEKQLNPLTIPKNKKISIPFYFPSFVLTKFNVKIFNLLYFLKGRISKKNKFVDWDSFFYPLDKILDWNKIYGKKGFAQFQCVIPLSRSKKAITELLNCISNSKSSSFLAVLKRFGPQKSNFSFPMEGYSLALDFPINSDNLFLMKLLDEITIKNGGRFYLAKDSRVKKDIFEKSDNRVNEFRKYREKLKFKFNSIQSKRLDL